MAFLKIATSFHPLRLTAYMKSEVEMTVEVTNESNEPYWMECIIEVPDVLSLVPDKALKRGKKRIGLIAPGETLSAKCKIYTTASAYPETYDIKITAFGYSRDGAIGTREEKKSPLRCERLGL